MKFSVAEGLASLIAEYELHDEYVIPNVFDPRVVDVVQRLFLKRPLNRD
ncbi:MAG: hypothetical protein WBI17_00245 [Clostridiaceae bacterium]